MPQCYDRAPSQRSTPLHTEAAGAAPFDAFGPFRVLHQIGAGAHGPVFRAYDPDQDRLVAVKLFQLDLAPDRVRALVEDLQRLIDADLGHPGIAAPIATGVAGASAFLAQDFVAADSLDIVMRELGPMPPADAVRLGAQLAAALDVAADAGVFHGALHPRDILVASDDARVTGLGLTQALERSGVPSATRRPYSAPERLAGQSWDRRADVFSLAALLAELITGRRVTGPAEPGVDGLPDDADGGAGRLRAIFAKALAEDPAERFPTAGAFVAALAGVVRPTESPGRVRGAAAPVSVEGLPGLLPERLPDRLPEVLMTPLLPLEPPAPAIPEARLPGDVPLDREAVAGATEPDWDLRTAPVDARGQTLVSDVPVTATAVESAPAPVAPPPGEPALRPLAPPAQKGSGRDVAQSAVWPLALALTVGLIVGVAIGFFVFGGRSLVRGAPDAEVAAVREMEAAPTTPAVVTPAAPAPAGIGGPVAAPGPEASAAGTAGTERSRPTTTPLPAASAASPTLSSDASSAGEGDGRRTSASPAAAPRARDAGRRRPERPAGVVAPAATGGRLLVRSSPAGARVWLDGQDVGGTPLTLRSLPFGTHTLRVTREGYESESRRVIISTAQPAQSLILDLTRVGTTATAGGIRYSNLTASLAVVSRPAGASVFLDGRRVGTTPLVLDAAPTGSHALRIELDGYRRWTSAVRVSAGESNRVTASLERY